MFNLHYFQISQLPWFKQFVYLFWRSSVGVSRDPKLNILRIILIGVACVLIQMSYVHLEETYTVSRANNIQGLLFLLASFFIIWNSLLVLAVLPKDLPLLIREHQDGLYQLSAYYITTFLVQSIVGTIFMIGSVSSIYFVVGLKRDPSSFFINLAVLIIIYLINVGFDALISAICEAPGKTVSNAIPCVILSNVTGGYFCTLGSMPRFLAPILAINWLPWDTNCCLSTNGRVFLV
ncbi:ABC transporter G family member 21-like [Strongylocentrotus purpuratus]|uniref:ABC-2 type transporter transmembrane domain-containing protein n=1 Tax=Strongylocentrotus purpuratus TaxID=7668 RepID=A0A7M7N3D0_STRPU|nr:ABC transporter G family member 21-like [Strongylocentrotus purpuratus]